jgi:hypothetical protein
VALVGFRHPIKAIEGNSQPLLITTGSADGGTSGDLVMDTGVGASNSNGSISIGASNSSFVYIGRPGSTVTTDGTLYVNNGLTVTSGGVGIASGGDLVLNGGNASINGNLTASGTITFSGLNTAGIVKNSASGVLSTGKVSLVADTTGSYIQNLGTLTGLTTLNNSGAGSTPTLAVVYGSTARTLGSGVTRTLICPSGTANLSGWWLVKLSSAQAGSCRQSSSVTSTPVIFWNTLSIHLEDN